MTSEPTSENIEQVVNLIGCERTEAVRWLRVKNNDPTSVVNAIFDQEDLTKLEQGTTWDESVYNTDREGNQNLHPLGTSAAPTRGPSPAPSLGISNPKTQADADSDLEAALALSRADFGGQETGVIQQDGTSVKFGPATKEQYDASQWAMVPTYSAAQEIVPDVPAKERQQHKKKDENKEKETDGEEEKKPNEPRMLKHLPDGDYTPNLITICHAIPRAREAFLMRDHTKSNYGHDPEWWRGHSIPVPRIVHMADGSSAEPDSDKHDELIAEMQRLMAFLDSSDRVYATIGGITDTDIIKNNNLQTTKSGSLLELFLQSWTLAAASKMSDHPGAIDTISRIFTTGIGTTAREGMDTPDMTVVDMSIEAEDDEKKDLFELLDNLLWDTDPNDLDRPDNYVEQPADILVMKVARRATATTLGLDVPASFFLDKYLKENVAATKSIRQQMAQGRKRINKIEEIEKKLQTWQHPQKSSQIDARKLLNYTLGHVSGKNRTDAADADETDVASLENAQHPHYPGITSQLEKVIASIDQKLERLAEEKEKTRKAVSEMSKAPLPDAEQKYRYTLRGVATKPNITYLLHPKSQDDDKEMILPTEDDTTPPGYQWWRLEYEVSSPHAKLHRTKAGDYDVLRAVELEHNSALLVYANDDATDSDDYNDELPLALKHFIVRDNRDFGAELSNESSDPPAYGDDIPRQSIEHRGSMDSLNVGHDDVADRLDLPGSPPSYDDADPAQHHAYGLGYTSKDPPVAEIHLDPLDGSGDDAKEIEMVEMPHPSLIPRPGTSSVPPSSDTLMGGMESQDLGMGGATHVEDTEMK